MSKLINLNLSVEGFTKFTNDGGPCTLANPSADFVQGLMGFPTASGKVVTHETAVRVATFLSGVKTLANDIAKMPLILRKRSTSPTGAVRTMEAVNEALYTLLKYCPNDWQTSYQLRWFLAAQLIMSGNAFCQIIRDGKGDLLQLIPLNAWHMNHKWDLTIPGRPVPYWVYSDGQGNLRRFEQKEIWHTTNTNISGSGLDGSSVIVLGKEAISVLMAAEETAGRNFANGLGMGGFLVAPPESGMTEVEAQNTVDRLKKDFSGSQNSGKFTILPGGLKWEKMTFNAQESQFLESRKWNAEEVIRLLGGAPLLVKMGMGAQNSTYASSSAFLEDYFQTSLLPHCTAIEQSITRDLVDLKDRSRFYAKHDSSIVLRGSLRERAETYEIQIRSGQMNPNEVRVTEDMDTVEGLDWFCLPANTAVFHDGEIYIPGQDLPGKEPDADDAGTKQTDKADKAKVTARLLTIANSLSERVIRKQTKGTITAEFVADVLACSMETAAEYVSVHKTFTESEARAAIINMVTNGDTNRESNGRFAPGSDSHSLIKSPEVNAQVTKLYASASTSFHGHGSDKIEHSFTVDGAGNPREIQSSHDSAKSSVTVHPGDKAIIHTHPDNTDPKPSPADAAIAKQFGIPNYELSKNQLWVANPDGTSEKVADVEWKNGELSIKWKA
jgi:HK97 family phage portal protein